MQMRWPSYSMQKLTVNSSVRNVLLVITIVYSALLTWGSLATIKLEAETPDNFDKLVHTVAYFGLTLLWLVLARSLRKVKLALTTSKALLIVFLAIIYGIIIELLQGAATDYRTKDIWDVAANSFGAILAFLVFITFINKSERLNSIF